MFFFKGFKKVQLLKEDSYQGTCQHCQSKGFLTFEITRKHFHIFWIPIFGLFKKATVHCSKCNRTTKEQEFNGETLREYELIKVKSRNTVWQFTGLIILPFIVYAALTSHDEDKKNEANWIKNPVKKDLYTIQKENSKYSTWRVDSVSNDSIYLSINKEETKKRWKTVIIDEPENYTSKSTISRDSLVFLYYRKFIKGITRSSLQKN